MIFMVPGGQNPSKNNEKSIEKTGPKKGRENYGKKHENGAKKDPQREPKSIKIRKKTSKNRCEK